MQYKHKHKKQQERKRKLTKHTADYNILILRVFHTCKTDYQSKQGSTFFVPLQNTQPKKKKRLNIYKA